MLLELPGPTHAARCKRKKRPKAPTSICSGLSVLGERVGLRVWAWAPPVPRLRVKRGGGRIFEPAFALRQSMVSSSLAAMIYPKAQASRIVPPDYKPRSNFLVLTTKSESDISEFDYDNPP